MRTYFEIEQLVPASCPQLPLHPKQITAPTKSMWTGQKKFNNYNHHSLNIAYYNSNSCIFPSRHSHHLSPALFGLFGSARRCDTSAWTPPPHGSHWPQSRPWEAFEQHHTVVFFWWFPECLIPALIKTLDSEWIVSGYWWLIPIGTMVNTTIITESI